MEDQQNATQYLERLETALGRIADASTRLSADIAAAQAMAESSERHTAPAPDTVAIAERLDALIGQLKTALTPKDAR